MARWGEGRKVRHGHTRGGKRSKTYQAWQSMLKRCEYPGDKRFARYGGRGISVCPQWHLFDVFLADMGESPVGMSLDRINNDGNYEPGNCRWVDMVVQANNRKKRSVRQITAFGRTQNVNQWASELKISRNTMRNRIARGCSPELILSTRHLRKGEVAC